MFNITYTKNSSSVPVPETNICKAIYITMASNDSPINFIVDEVQECPQSSRRVQEDFRPDAPPVLPGTKLRAKNWFLTFPQCAVTKEQAMEELKGKFKEGLLGCLIAQEKHQDGTPHLHIFVRLAKALSTRDRKFFDFVCKKHGNYLTVRSQYGVYNYLTKSDPTPLSHGSVLKPGSAVAKAQSAQKRKRAEDGGNPKQSKASKVASDLLSGASIVSIMRQDPGYYLLNKKKIEEFASMASLWNLKELKPKWTPINYQGMDQSTKELAEWLNQNIGVTRYFRQEQLYLCGPKQTYKSTLMRLLNQFLMIYDIPKGEDFYDLYEDGLYDLAVIDEFKANKSLQWLNEWLQGGDMNIRKKGAQYYKRKNIPTVIMSNFTLQDVYRNALAKDNNILDPTESRLKMIHLSAPLDIKGLALAMGLQDSDVMRGLVVNQPAQQIVQDLTDSHNDGDISDVSVNDTTTNNNNLQVLMQAADQAISAQKLRKKYGYNFCATCGEQDKHCECKGKEPEEN